MLYFHHRRRRRKSKRLKALYKSEKRRVAMIAAHLHQEHALLITLGLRTTSG